jgi:hypothetical protein
MRSSFPVNTAIAFRGKEFRVPGFEFRVRLRTFYSELGTRDMPYRLGYCPGHEPVTQ